MPGRKEKGDTRTEPDHMNSEWDWGSWNWNPTLHSPEVGDTNEGTVPESLLKEVPGELVWNESGSVYVQTHVFRLTSDLRSLSFALHGETYLDGLQIVTDMQNCPGHQSLHNCVFVDCETTGLGHLSIPFMVGVATYEHVNNLSVHQPLASPDGSSLLRTNSLSIPQRSTSETPTHFVVRQLFAWHPGEEGALLETLQSLVAPYRICVTFNGNSFDLPLLQRRYQNLGIRFPELPLNDPFANEGFCSLDLLPIARRLWRRRIGSCALTNCERQILGVRRTHADVHGSQIPGIYRQFLDTGRARALSQVFYHNRQDIISMAFLLERIAKTLSEPCAARSSQICGEDALAISQILMRQGDSHRGVDLLRYAIRALAGSTLQAEAFCMLATWYKRQQDWTNAVLLWEEWLSTAVEDSPLPYVELAKFHEWQQKDLDQAEVYTRWAMHVSAATGYRGGNQVQELALKHRLRRVQRKKASRANR